jgi:hypothetical protein
LTQGDIAQLWAVAGGAEVVSLREFDSVLNRAAGQWRLPSLEPGQLGMMVGRYEIDLRLEAARGGVLTVFAAAALLPHGFTRPSTPLKPAP